jgi:aryl-alcohol dehydrogenase-like predicted oxidoreductase
VNTLKKIPDRKLKAAKGAFDASIDCGITFFDTAEVYGAGVRNRKASCLITHSLSASL